MYVLIVRFIRFDANEALDAFAENVSLHKAILLLKRLGVGHKHVVARTTSGRLIAHITESIGTEAIYNGLNERDSREASEAIFRSAISLMSDGSLDVRQEAKRIFSILMQSDSFEKSLGNIVSGDDLTKIRKQLDSFKAIVEKQKSA